MPEKWPGQRLESVLNQVKDGEEMDSSKLTVAASEFLRADSAYTEALIGGTRLRAQGLPDEFE